ncbi:MULTISPECIES: LysM peptidoglycan-binding domain-containing protein [unclassified Sphingomonas]|uniref:LysM peptidoglycan-binding domain-containing protein n=1 Tax=unclassified Sphingomonas TaxID=196159 RepID=UPI0019106742|nr:MULTISPECIES: LysM peptidoglycan-binding domain-containing protein [unclassified Sphingomonas]
MAGGRIHIVGQGETLSLIARRYGTGVRTLARLNGIRNPDRIGIGQRLLLPGALSPPTRRTAPRPSRQTTQIGGGRLELTAIDVLNIKKTVQTEWVQWAGAAQAHGIIDTILNRTASGRWGSTVASVVNAPFQFSDINGPISRRHGRRSVEQYPASSISTRVHQTVDDYLALRAAGRASIVDTHLNYANPKYSDAKNLKWINALDGPRLGRGDAVHYHGTVPELQRRRPGRFRVVLSETAEPDHRPPATANTIDGNAVAAANGVQVKNAGVRIGRLDPAMSLVIRAVAEIAVQQNLPTPVITSGNDSHHGRRSLHYADRALDFRGNNITVAQGRALQVAVRQRLGNDYDVLFETFPNPANNHLRVEHDPN